VGGRGGPGKGDVKSHIDLVGILYMLGGGLALLVAISLALLGIAAMSLASADGARLAGRFSALVFFSLAGVCLAWGLANVLAGRALRRGHALARLGALVLSIVNLFILPFGTALSVYSLWVLLHDETRRLFEAGSQGTHP
jgi:hypothetical protein